MDHKRKQFRYLAEVRTSLICGQIALLDNLKDREKYTYTVDEVFEITGAIGAATDEIQHRLLAAIRTTEEIKEKAINFKLSKEE